MDSFSIDDLKKEVTPPSATAEVFLDGQLIAEIDELEHQLAKAQEDDSRQNREPEAPLIAQRIVELHNQAKDKARTFTFTAKSARWWSDLLADHPPSKADREKGYDYDPRTFPHEAMSATCSPKLSPDDFRWLEEHLSPGQFERLWLTCRAVHQVVAGPKAQPSAIATRLATGPRLTTALPVESPEASSSVE